MPNISKITLPNNLTYDIKDTTARTNIENIQAIIGSLTGANVVVFRGVSSTVLTDGGNENPTINNSAVTSKRTGDVYFYGTEEFIYGSDNKWHALGSLDTLGTFAFISTITGQSSEQFVKSMNSTALTMDVLTSQVLAHYPTVEDNYYNISAGTPTQHVYSWTTTQSGQTITHTKQGYQPEGSISASGSVNVVSSASINAYDSNAVRIFSKDPANGETTYTPAGTVAITESSSPATTIKNPTSVTVAKTIAVAAPGATAPANNLTYYAYDGTNEVLKLYQLGYTTGASITTSNVSVKKGDASYTAAFTGTEKTLYARPYITSSEIVDKLQFTGTPVYLTAHGTPSGTVTPSVNKGFVSTTLNGSNGS